MGAGQAIAILGAVAGIRLLTERLAPADYGDVTLSLTVAALLNLLGSGPIANAVSRFYSVSQQRGTLRCFFGSVSTLYVQYHLGACAFALCCLVVYCGKPGPAGRTSLGLYTIALSMIEGASRLLDAMQNAARQRLVVAWHQAAGQWFRTAGALLLIRLAGAKAESAIAGYAAAALLAFGSQFVFFKLKLSRPAAGEPEVGTTAARLVTREMRGYANPFLWLAVIVWLQQASDRWLLAAFGSRTEVGLYQALTQVGYAPLIQLSGLISLVVAPILFLHAGDGSDSGDVNRQRGRVRQLSWLMFLGTLVIAGLLWLVGQPLFALVVAPEYRSAARYLPLAALSGGWFATGQMLTLDVLVQMKSKPLLLPKVGSALIAVALNYGGVRAFGFRGLVWAGVAASGIYALWMSLLIRSTSPAGTRTAHR